MDSERNDARAQYAENIEKLYNKYSKLLKEIHLIKEEQDLWRAGIPNATVLYGEPRNRRGRPSKPKLKRVV
jgi:hypothetical protein